MKRRWPPGRILVPLDLSDRSRHALEYATEVARCSEATLVVLHVGVPLPFGRSQDLSATAAAEVQAEIADQQRSLGLAALREELAVVGEVPVEVAYAEGEPAAAIVQSAKEQRCGLIVLASHGRSGVRRALLGSVAERVARLAECPVTIVR